MLATLNVLQLARTIDQNKKDSGLSCIGAFSTVGASSLTCKPAIKDCCAFPIVGQNLTFRACPPPTLFETQGIPSVFRNDNANSALD